MADDNKKVTDNISAAEGAENVENAAATASETSEASEAVENAENISASDAVSAGNLTPSLTGGAIVEEVDGERIVKYITPTVKREIIEDEKKPLDYKKPKKKNYRHAKQLNRSKAGNGLLFFIMIICGIFMALPLVMIFNNALKPLDEIYQYPPKIFVRNPSFDNFSDLFIIMNDSWVPFSRYILNTIIITGFGTVGHVIVASFAAYPLAKHNFPGKKIIFSMVVLSMMFSWTVTQIPNYMIITWLGLNNTYLALILPAWQFGMGLYLMKQFMEQIPDSLLESARLDGAGEVKTFWTMVMPNVKPAWLTLAIFQFQQMWGNTGATYIRSEQLKPLQFALQQIAAGGTARAGAAAAVSFIIAAIPIIFFLLCQSNIIETMTTSGMKD